MSLATTRHHARRQTAPVQFPQLQLPRLELCFKDGSLLWLEQVTGDELTRRVGHTVVNLRQIAPALWADYQAATPLDRPAVIFFTLRQQFPTAEAFLAAAQAGSAGTRH